MVKSCHGDRSEKLSDADARLYIKVLYTDYTGGEGSLIAGPALTVLGDVVSSGGAPTPAGTSVFYFV